MQTLKNIVNLLIELSDTSGEDSKKQKIELLRNNESPELLYVLDVCFNPLITTHINVVEEIDDDYVGSGTFEGFKELVENLKLLRAVTNLHRKEVSIFVYGCPDYNFEEHSMLAKIITKNVNIGIGRSIINEAFGYELIPNNEMMKADDNIEIVRNWFKEDKVVYAEEKLDGVRMWAEIFEGKVVRFNTYNFQELPIEFMSTLAKQLRFLLPKNNKRFFIDGELTGKDRQSVSGQVNKILKGTAKEGIDKDFVYHIFDYDSLDSVKTGEGKLPYYLRKKLLHSLFQSAHPDDITNIRYVRKYLVKSWTEVQKIFDKIVEDGGEGLIAKLGSHVYELKRSKSWIKMKETKECDLKVVSIFAGKKGTKREDTVGGFVCESEDKQLTVEVGSGFSDELLLKVKENPDYYIGKVVSVKYNVKIHDKYGNNSLFLPRLSEVRFDKFKANNYKEIK